MLTYFKCPDGNVVPIKDCLVKCNRQEGRCLSLPTLYEIGNVREWTGIPSTTQLLKGVRQAYLELVKPYTINPMDTAFMLLGTRHHQKLDFAAKKLGLTSEKKVGKEISGILDLLEPDELNPDCFKLIDYKTSGSFAIAKALGRKNDTGESDMREWELQTNKYRIELESLGLKISRIFIQACVRDGGTFSAKNNNVPEKFIMIPVKKLDDTEVFYYFHDKSEALLKALENKTLPKMCDYTESWGNRRCKGFCSVSDFCPEGAKMNRVQLRDA